MFEDKDIPTADPEALINQYMPLVTKLANRYRVLLERSGSVDLDDLLQAGRIAIFDAQKDYTKGNGVSFLTCVYNRVKWYILRTLGYKNGKLPPVLRYLDEPIQDQRSSAEDSDRTLMDTIPDPTLTAEENTIEQDERQETIDAVHAALDRLKNAKQREVVTRCWLNEQTKPEAAAEMGIKLKSLQQIDLEARYKLRRDIDLKRFYALRFPLFRVSVSSFHSTFTSATEKAVLWRERKYDEMFGDGSFANLTGRQDPDGVQTSFFRTEAKA